jgi:capsular exopolysaccharide synthesis family protein
MDLRTYLTAIRKGWWIVVTLAVLGAGAGAFIAYRATPIYAAKLTFYVRAAVDPTNPASSAQLAQDRATSYAELLPNNALSTSIVQATKLPMTPGEVSGEISASAVINTQLLRVTVKDPSAQRALVIAGAVGSQFPKQAAALDGGTPKLATSLVPTAAPTASNAPVSPRRNLDIALGLSVGLLLGLLGAVTRERLDTGVRSEETFTSITEAPVLATIPYDKRTKHAPLVLGNAAYSIRAEAFRQLRTNLQFLDAARPAKVIVISSSLTSEGKSVTTANLGLVFAEIGRRVLLIEADLRRPHLSEYFGVDRSVGLSNVLAGQVKAADVIQNWGIEGIDLLASGLIPPNPSELLSSQRMSELIDDLRNRYDVIILDPPPLLPVTDAALTAVQADGVVILVRHGKTSRSQLTAATNALRSVDARILGGVINMKRMRRSANRSYRYYEEPKKTPAQDADLWEYWSARTEGAAAPASPGPRTDLTDDTHELPTPGGGADGAARSANGAAGSANGTGASPNGVHSGVNGSSHGTGEPDFIDEAPVDEPVERNSISAARLTQRRIRERARRNTLTDRRR